MYLNLTQIARASFARCNFLFSSRSTMRLHQHLKMILGDVTPARELHLGAVTGTVSIFACWKIRPRTNYIAEKTNIPQAQRKKKVLFPSLWRFRPFCRHATEGKRPRGWSGPDRPRQAPSWWDPAQPGGLGSPGGTGWSVGTQLLPAQDGVCFHCARWLITPRTPLGMFCSHSPNGIS